MGGVSLQPGKQNRSYSYINESKGLAIEQTELTAISCKLDADWLLDRKSTRLNSSHVRTSRMPSSA